MKEILKPKSKALTEKDCYEELARIIKIYCYQAVVREEIEFFRWWVKNVLTQLSEYAPSPEEPGKYPAYKELLRKASEFVREPAEERKSARSGEKSLSDNDVFRTCGAACSGIGGKRRSVIYVGYISNDRGRPAINSPVGL